LLRALAPIPDAAWREIDHEVRQRLTPQLAARKLVDWNGPHGWDFAATNLGRIRQFAGSPSGSASDSGIEGVHAVAREVLPVVELRVPFEVSRNEVAAVERGALDSDWPDLERAARQLALAENRAVFTGWPEAGVTGISQASTHGSWSLGEDVQEYPKLVARAVDRLRCAGIAGPYALAISPEGYTRIVETTEHGGYPLFDHLPHILGGPVVWAPGVDGAIVLSQRGGDFLFDSGQDISIGYASHDGESVELYLEETFTFRVVEPDAAIALRAV
jgi:uncharacterized linocin/CFP29 family protein